MDHQTLGYVALFAPFAACVLITLLTLRSKAASAGVAVLGIVASLAATALLAKDVLLSHEIVRTAYEIDWLSVGRFSIPFGVQIDALSVMMSAVVTVVGLCVFVYSTAYMKGDPGWSRYFACLSLFAFSMQGIVFSTNLVQTFIFWELVGVSSYSLIGYYFAKPSAVDAGKKAFLTNRIGDFGMTCGILLLFFTLVSALGWGGVSEGGQTFAASFSFDKLAAVFQSDQGGAVAQALAPHSMSLGFAAFLIFTGAIAKSAQVPLHVWLPDAMEGPTPVSALMHAATMVAAGVYLGCRTYFMLAPSPDWLEVIAWIGGITSFVAATMAFVQHDIKKVLAYSTLSQLGYMVLALGLLAPAAAMFHLVTHAAFKALLFLGAGSVIHGCHHEQDMRNMGGLFKKMPITAITFWIGTLALAGIFPLAGFWSKDAVLGAAHDRNTALYVIGLGVAFMTAAYMGRCCFLTFHGKYRGHAHPHESPSAMTAPLVLLALFAVVAGLINIPGDFAGISAHWLEHSLTAAGASVAESAPVSVRGVPPEAFHMIVAIVGSVLALLGLLVGWLFYGARKLNADKLVTSLGPVHSLVKNGYFFDDFYNWLVQGVQQRIAVFCDFVEVQILRRIVDAVGAVHRGVGQIVRLLMDGHVHRYVSLALLGAAALLAWVLVGG